MVCNTIFLFLFFYSPLYLEHITLYKLFLFLFSCLGTRLFSAGGDGQIIEWDLNAGKLVRNFSASKQAISKIMLSADDSLLLTSGSNIKLWNVATQTLLARYSGHVSPVNSLEFINGINVFASGAAEDRFINVWALEAVSTVQLTKKQKKKSSTTGLIAEIPFYTTPICSLSLESPPVSIASRSAPTALISAVSSCGVATIWDLAATLATKPSTSVATTIALTQPSSRISVEGEEITGEAVAAMSMFNTKNNKQRRGKKLDTSSSTVSREGAITITRFIGADKLSIARNSSVQPKFDVARYLDVNEAEDTNSFVTNVILTPFAIQNLITTSGAVKRKDPSNEISKTSFSAAVVGPAHHAITQSASSLDGDVIVASKEDVPETLHNKRMKLLHASGDLSKSLASRIRETEQQAEKLRASYVGGSLETVLTQALQNDDDELLEQCISVGVVGRSRKGPSVIRNTLARIAPAYVVPLLIKIINKLQGNANRGLELIPWMRESLRIHAAYLLTVPQLASHLSTLYKILEYRLNPFKKLLSLQGRLDLVLSQVNRKGSDGNFDEMTTMYDESKDNGVSIRDIDSEDDMDEDGIDFDSNDEFDDLENDLIDDEE